MTPARPLTPCRRCGGSIAQTGTTHRSALYPVRVSRIGRSFGSAPIATRRGYYRASDSVRLLRSKQARTPSLTSESVMCLIVEVFLDHTRLARFG